jgi:hypothetical protein
MSYHPIIPLSCVCLSTAGCSSTRGCRGCPSVLSSDYPIVRRLSADCQLLKCTVLRLAEHMFLPPINVCPALCVEKTLTVGGDACAGCVLVTFKSRYSLPPYRVENLCSDVVVWYCQEALKFQQSKWNWLAPRPGGNSMAYAWDEPTLDHRLRVHVRARSRGICLSVAKLRGIYPSTELGELLSMLRLSVA